MATAISRGNAVGICVVDVFVSAPPALPTIGADTVTEVILTVPGVRFTDVAVSISPSGQPAGIGVAGVRVVGDEQVAVSYSNNTAAPIVLFGGRNRITIARLDAPLNAFQG